MLIKPRGGGKSLKRTSARDAWLIDPVRLACAIRRRKWLAALSQSNSGSFLVRVNG
jgi:hypothetical protein